MRGYVVLVGVVVLAVVALVTFRTAKVLKLFPRIDTAVRRSLAQVGSWLQDAYDALLGD